MSVAVMTRIQLIEAPYLNEFVSWYIQLGFNRVYFLNTDCNNEKRIKEFIDPELLKKVTFVHHIGPTNNFKYLRRVFRNVVTEDYVMHADSDEYLMLPKQYPTISDFVEEHSYDLYRFYWVNIPIQDLYQRSMTEYLHSDQAAGRFGANSKMMVKRTTWLDDLKASCDPHNFKCKGTLHTFCDESPNGQVPFYIHFLVRGYLHTIIKMFEQTLPTQRGQTPKEMIKKFVTDTLTFREYPFRVLIANGEYCMCTRDYVTSNIVKWRLPIYTHRECRSQTLQLYTEVLAKYDITHADDILEHDVFGLAEKTNQHMGLITEKHQNELADKTPAEIAVYLQNHI